MDQYIRQIQDMFLYSYGDKVPKSIIGRLFGVIWINVGLVILAMFMGIITTSLTANSLGHVTTLYGMSVSLIYGMLQRIPDRKATET